MFVSAFLSLPILKNEFRYTFVLALSCFVLIEFGIVAVALILVLICEYEIFASACCVLKLFNKNY